MNVPVISCPSKSAADICLQQQIPEVLHQQLSPTSFGNYELSIFSDIGGRKCQEDRFSFCPKLIPNRPDCAFFGVFDGTVGDFASETVKGLVVPHLLGSAAWRRVCDALYASPPHDNLTSSLSEAISSMYRNADDELVYQCALHKKDYASSTSVTAVLVGGYLGVGHLGDSRIAVGSLRSNTVAAEFLTNDHKPDQPAEKDRIMANGGSVEYLHNHNNKPFIRGGDFTVRKGRGEQPMQLQYSRAFGGKDLKQYGLSNDPDVRVLSVDSSWQCMILASDGLWDILAAETAVNMALAAKKKGEDPAKFLVKQTLEEQKIRNQCADNITAMVVIFT